MAWLSRKLRPICGHVSCCKPQLSRAHNSSTSTPEIEITYEMIETVSALWTVPLKWDTLTIAQAQALENFFVGKGGDTPFLYALSDDTTRQWRCKEFARERSGTNTFDATLIEDFSPVA